jgi:hypothetical protein
MIKLPLTLVAALVAGMIPALAVAQENPGHHYGWRNQGQYGQCGAGYNRGRGHRQDNDDDNNDDRDNQGPRNYPNQNGYPNQYGYPNQNGYPNQSGYPNQYGSNPCVAYGNTILRGQIVAVNGNMVSIREQNPNGYYGQVITLNDQPALNNRTSGRVYIGRWVTAYGYWQYGTFYATRLV